MSEKTVFISYRRDPTGKFFARSLKEALTQKGYDVFLDVDCIDAGQWATQILTQVPKRAHFLLLLTPGALDRCSQEDDWVRREFLKAMESQRNIVPVREESVDLGELRKSCPDSLKALFDYQIATIQHSGFARDVATLIERFIPPHKAPTLIAPSSPPATEPEFRADISRIVEYAPAELIGREAETQLLNDAWTKVQQHDPNRPHVLTFVALGGEGKTSLVAKWTADLAGQDWPGCDVVFAWSFYSQGTREQVAASSDLFLKEALLFFGNDADKAFAAGPAGAYEKGQRLARIVGQRRNLLILDGLEPLQYAPNSPTPGELKDQGLAALLKGLAASSQGLCVVTTRYSIPDLRAFWQSTAPEEKLTRLSRDAGVHLLQKLGVQGSLLRNIPFGPDHEQVNEFEKLVEDVKGHALTLQIMGGFLKRAFHGDIRCRDRVHFDKADEKIDGGHAFRAMDAHVKWMEGQSDEAKRELAILRLMGLFDRPATDGCIKALLKTPAINGLTEPLAGAAEDDWQYSLDALDSANLLTVNRDTSGALLSLDAHPHIREYFDKQLREKNPEVWRTAHRRLYEHLCAATKEGDKPTLEDLQPLYQAVAHGCQAGMQQDACDKIYHDRISKGSEDYAIKKLGAFGSDLGAVACFFEIPWNRLASALTEKARSWMMSNAAFALRALGRLAEALEPMRSGLEMDIEQGHGKNAAIYASNLSQLELTLGELTEALRDAEQSVIYADHAGDAFQRVINRTTHADALHQAGRRAEAEERFREAEKMQADSWPEQPVLSSLQGFLYCDLLVVAAERAAWQAILSLTSKSITVDSAVSDCRAVSRRVATTIKIAQHNNWLLDIALDHLTLGRTALYSAILDRSNSNLPTAISEISAAVDTLRRAGTQHRFPTALLTRAWLRGLTGTLTGSAGSPQTGPGSAKEDLDEAWEIASRGPMLLFMADIHLHRVRLFFRESPYPWQSPEADLKAARALIEKCGYWRRKEELEDAELAILGSVRSSKG